MTNYDIFNIDEARLYNPNQKIKFLREYGSSPTTTRGAASVLALAAPYEKRLEKDLCLMNAEEIEGFINGTGAARIKGKIAYIQVIKAYVRWCIQKGVKGINIDFRDVRPVGVEIVRKRYVSGPAQLQMCLDGIYDPENLRTTDNVYRGYLWLAFSGVKKELSDQIKCSDIDFRNMKITHDGASYPIYAAALPALHILVESDSFEYYHPNYSGPILRKRVPGDLLLRGIRGNANTHLIANKVSRDAREGYATGKINCQLSYNTMHISGKFYREHENEVAGIGVNIDRLVDEELEDADWKGKKEGTKTYGKKKAEKRIYLRNEYETWKLAFGL